MDITHGVGGSKGESDLPEREHIIELENLERRARDQDFLDRMLIRRDRLVALTDANEYVTDPQAKKAREEWRVFFRDLPLGLWIEYKSTSRFHIYNDQGQLVNNRPFTFVANFGGPINDRILMLINTETGQYTHIKDIETMSISLPPETPILPT